MGCAALLDVLSRRASDLGVDVQHGREVHDLSDFDDTDLIVAPDFGQHNVQTADEIQPGYGAIASRRWVEPARPPPTAPPAKPSPKRLTEVALAADTTRVLRDSAPGTRRQQ
ncbi:hypothetical protein AB4305_28825 [Nocardia sp. 2YAB30]|uniref:hypothetical protein n=1 Tax=Nocardia sp. 2YAB30 TaxID=3233022 RepID=UPI003F96B702